MKKYILPLSLAIALIAVAPLQGEFLYTNFLTPSFDGQPNTEYTAWDVFYAPNNSANYPDIAAPNGTRQTRSAAGFPANSTYSPTDPLAFWDVNNATITQTSTTNGGAFIIGPGTTGNIYSFSTATRFELVDDTPYQTNVVSFQFQSEGTLADFANIRLIYNDGTSDISLAATNYIREYNSSGSSFGGYGNRSALQWNLSGLNISSYKIVLPAKGSSMSFQRALLDTAATYASVVPVAHSWNAAGPGNWSDGSKWLEGSTSVTNGNVKFVNSAAANINLDGDRTFGELIFNNPNNVTINSVATAAFTSNTGITTKEAATGIYTINSEWKLGSFNIYELAAGTVNISGVISGNYGILKNGNGILNLTANNAFTGGVGVEGGVLRLSSSNSYTGTTTALYGTILVAADAFSGVNGALGNSTTNITIGASNTTFSDPGIAAELFIDGDHTVERNIVLAQGPFEKRLGAQNTTGGAVFSGNVNLGTPAASNVHFLARNVGDKVTFSGAISGGATSATVFKDGSGTVIFSGTDKTYDNATTVSSGTLQINSGFTGNGNLTLTAGSKLVVNGTLGGSGTLSVNSGIIGGNGTINRTFTVGAGAILTPGNSVGTLNTVAETWAGGGSYIWEISNATTTAGTGWDLINSTGALNLTSSATNKFTIALTSLTAANNAGLVENFDANSNYIWKIASASNSINGLDASAFTLDSRGFQNALNGGFTITQTGNELFIVYTTVPEPSTYALFGSGLGLLAWRKRRKLSRKDS